MKYFLSLLLSLSIVSLVKARPLFEGKTPKQYTYRYDGGAGRSFKYEGPKRLGEQTLVLTEPVTEKPKWIYALYTEEKGDSVAFVGLSPMSESEQEARSGAFRHTLFQIRQEAPVAVISDREKTYTEIWIVEKEDGAHLIYKTYQLIVLSREKHRQVITKMAEWAARRGRER